MQKFNYMTTHQFFKLKLKKQTCNICTISFFFFLRFLLAVTTCRTEMADKTASGTSFSYLPGTVTHNQNCNQLFLITIFQRLNLAASIPSSSWVGATHCNSIGLFCQLVWPEKYFLVTKCFPVLVTTDSIEQIQELALK